MPFRFRRLEIPDLVLVEARGFPDARGFFAETYKRSEFRASGIPDEFVQDNWSRSVKGVLRGLHYQAPPRPQAKLVIVTRGAVFDVAVDLRRRSPTYRRWAGVTLAAEERKLLYLPAGFAHGFLTLSDEADVLYKVSAEYAPELDRGILWNDPEIGIRWPVEDPILSPKDAALPRLADAGPEFE